MDPRVAGFLGLLMIGSIYIYYYGLKQIRLYEKIKNTPTCKIVAAYPGIIEIQGRARKCEKLLESPVSKKPCVFYFVETRKWAGSGKRRRCIDVGTIQSRDYFYIEDETGRIKVDPESISKNIWGIRIDKEYEIRNMHDEAKSFILKNYPELAGYNDKIEIYERYIQEGDPLYILGTAKIEENGGRSELVIKNASNMQACTIDGSEKDAEMIIGTSTKNSLIAIPAIFFILFFLFLLEIGVNLANAFAFAASATMLMYCLAALVVLAETYNGIVQLKMQISMAKSNLDALYKRRENLVPMLEKVVLEASKHEKNLQNEIAKARRKPQDSKKTSLLALAEKYPEIKSNQNYIAFQKELTETENWIAASRQFLVDSVALYNTKIQTYPYSIIAKNLGYEPIKIEI